MGICENFGLFLINEKSGAGSLSISDINSRGGLWNVLPSFLYDKPFIVSNGLF